MSYQDYQKFLNLLKDGPVPFHCSICTSHSHCHHWMPPSLPSKNAEKTAKFKPGRKYPHFTSKKHCCGNKWKHPRKKRPSEASTPVQPSDDSDKDRNVPDHETCSDCQSYNLETSSAAVTPAGSCSELSGPSGLFRGKPNTPFTKMLQAMAKDKKVKEKNHALRKKVVRLEKQLKAHEQANQLLDTNWIEDLIKNYQDILRKFMKLDEKYKSLQKRDGKQQHDKGEEKFAAIQADNPTQESSVHFQEKGNGWKGNQADPEQQEQNFPGNDQSTCPSGIMPGSSRPPSATTVVIVGGNTAAAAPSNGNRRASRLDTMSADLISANRENLQNVHLEGEISMVHRNERPAGISRVVNQTDSSTQINFTEEEFEARLRRSYNLYEERLEQVRAEYDHVIGEYRRENTRYRNRETELIQERDGVKRQLDEQQRVLERDGDARQELVSTKREVDELKRALARLEESRDCRNPVEATPLTVEHLQSILERLNVGDSTDQSRPGTSGSLGQVASSTRNCLQTVRQMIEDCLDKWQSIVVQQKTEGAAAQLEHLRTRCDTLTEERRALASQLETERKTAESLTRELRDSQRKTTDMERTCSELRQQEREATDRLRETTTAHTLQLETLQTAVDDLRRQLQAAQTEVTDAAGQRQRVDRHLEDLNRTTADLKRQLEERITENCRLHTDIEKRTDEVAKAVEARRRLETELNEASRVNQTKIREVECELQSVSARRVEQEGRYESQIRQLRLELDQMRIRNETFQRQLAAITSTYNHMFAATTTDASD